MKKVITEKVLEEIQYFCDKHPDRECFSELKTASWYGSKFDMNGLEIHFCVECLDDFYMECLQKYKIAPKNLDIW